MRRSPIITVAVTALLVLSGVGAVAVTAADSGEQSTTTPEDAPERPSVPTAFLEEFDLPAETSEAIADEIESMREAGASRADLHHAVHYLLYQEGYDTEDVHLQSFAFRLSERFDISDADAEDIVTDARAMHADGADRQEIRDLVHEELTALGVDVPDRRAATLGERFSGSPPATDSAPDMSERMRPPHADGEMGAALAPSGLGPSGSTLGPPNQGFGPTTNDRPAPFGGPGENFDRPALTEGESDD